jgi:hypothetical protein
MQVLGFAARGGDRVNVDVEDAVVKRLEIAKARFLTRFAERRDERIRFVFGVPAELQPTIEASMMMEEDASGAVEHERARGDVPGRKRPSLKAPPFSIDEGRRGGEVSGLERIGR